MGTVATSAGAAGPSEGLWAVIDRKNIRFWDTLTVTRPSLRCPFRSLARLLRNTSLSIPHTKCG